MANLPPSLSIAPAFAAPGAPTPAPAVFKDQNMAAAEQLVLNLCNPELRERALLDLSKKREIFPDLAPILWHSFGTIATLLQEIVSIYPSLSPSKLLSPDQSNRVCNVLVLLQCVATNSDTRPAFLAAQIPLYLYPFLNTQNKERQYEYLRLTSLGVIGALVKVDDPEVIKFLVSSELIPLCLRAMEMGSDLSKTVATFIVQKIMLDDNGLNYICSISYRCFAITSVLAQMADSAEHNPSARLLKHIIRCYLRLTDDARACSLLHKNKHELLPISLINGTSNKYLQDDLTMGWLQQLVHKVNSASRGGPHTGLDHMMGL